MEDKLNSLKSLKLNPQYNKQTQEGDEEISVGVIEEDNPNELKEEFEQVQDL